MSAATSTALSSETLANAIVYYRKWGMISGMALMLLCCVWGLPPITDLSQNYKAYKGAHHQWAHAGELWIAAALCFPYVKFESLLSYKILFISMQLAMFCNGAAYAVAALSGDFWIGTATGTDEPKDEDNTERSVTVWSIISLAFVPVITGLSCFVAFPMFIYGLLKNVDGASLLKEMEVATDNGKERKVK